MTNIISYKDFKNIDIRVGTIISAQENYKLKKPSIILEIDFGKEIGIKKSSAQLTKNYNKKAPEGIILDELSLTKMCCRRHMLTHVDIE